VADSDDTAPVEPEGDRPEHPLMAFGAGVAVFALAVVVGLLSSFYATALILLGAVHLSIGALIAGAFTLAGGLVVSWALRSRDAALLPGIGWFVGLAILVFSPTSGGDVLVPGSGDDVYAFIAAGAGGAVVAGLYAFRGVFFAVFFSRPGRATPRA
jgi:hypothetical protein